MHALWQTDVQTLLILILVGTLANWVTLIGMGLTLLWYVRRGQARSRALGLPPDYLRYNAEAKKLAEKGNPYVPSEHRTGIVPTGTSYLTREE